ncbi:hypothetical protein BCR35DRAFT_329665 [Leucosporidium creatinivorum]|uniref:Uncharacterized protein n=1 Tax=Leucosporidium creatinivorum TaxID=106004 RepID=A0A1Y2FXH0_9BASI|nr:hypothetical protein BCR35DRAFT_329665 [Leucosporidium creatinivorum]
MAPPQGSSKHGSQDSSQMSDDSGVQALIAARTKEAKSAKAAHEKAKQTLQRAQQTTAEYEKKVSAVLEEHTTRVQKKIKEHQTLEKKLLEEMEAVRIEVLGLIARNGEILDKFFTTATRDTEKILKDYNANSERIEWMAKEEENSIKDAIDHLWDVSDEDQEGGKGTEGA